MAAQASLPAHRMRARVGARTETTRMRLRLILGCAALLLAACGGEGASPPSPLPPPVPATPASAPPAAAARAPEGIPGDDTGPSACDWTRLALPVHEAMVHADALALARSVPVDDSDSAQLAALLRRPPQPPGDLRGDWRVRSLQFSDGRVYGYPWFRARIGSDDCAGSFAKLNGSQRRSGRLYPIQGDPRRLAFLGAATVNDEPPVDYDPTRPADAQWPGHGNSAGWLARLGRDELLMVLDAGDGRFEVYHLRR